MKTPKLKPITWKSVEAEVRHIKPTPNNFKIKTDLGKQLLHNSISKFGQAGTVVCNWAGKFGDLKNLMLVDGNSRIVECKEKGQKKVWVSVPSRKLSAKEFEEMAAMFDYAVAGTVDTDRIKGELGKTQEFFKFWGMSVPQEILNRLGKAEPIASSKSNGSNSKTPVVPEQVYKVELFFTEKQEAQFRKMEDKLAAKWKTVNTTETVLRAIKEAYK